MLFCHPGKTDPRQFPLYLPSPGRQSPDAVRILRRPCRAGKHRSLFLNIQYGSGGLLVTTGTSLKVFTMDKTLEHAFDDAIRRFLLNHEIDFDEQ